VMAGGTVICKKPVSAEVAMQGRDALAMEIYDRMFAFILRKLNEVTGGSDETSNNGGKIGLLDVPGFERNEQNGLDQMCNNYISETVHKMYLDLVLKDVKGRTDKEEIDYNFKFDYNGPTLVLIDGPSGIMSTLNEVTRTSGTHDKFLSRVVQAQRKAAHFVPAKSSFTHEFGIRHTIGTVMYQVNNFVSENSVQAPVDLLECIAQCSNDLLVQEFKTTTPKPNSSTTTWTRTKKQFSDVWIRLAKAQPNFIQCIQPNDMMRPKIMLHVETVNQLQGSHMVAALKLQQIASQIK